MIATFLLFFFTLYDESAGDAVSSSSSSISYSHMRRERSAAGTSNNHADIEAQEKAEHMHLLNSITFLVLLGLLVLSILVAWAFKRYHLRFLHETGVSLLIGIIAGLIIYLDNLRRGVHVDKDLVCFNPAVNYSSPAVIAAVAKEEESSNLQEQAQFNPEFFFFVLLPPIIFNAGFEVKQKYFFKHLGAILTYALVGTAIAIFLTGGIVYFGAMTIPGINVSLPDALIFGSLISATDPVTVLAIFNELRVDVDLYALVFGESVLNDAVCLVLYSSIVLFKATNAELTAMTTAVICWDFLVIFIGSMCVGLFIAFLNALVCKFTNLGKYPTLETIFFILVSYGSYLVGEAFGLTGIVCILFAGLAQARYTRVNLSPDSKKYTKDFFHLINFMCENFIFSYVGISMFTFECHIWNVRFILLCLGSIIIARAVMVHCLTWGVNQLRRPQNRVSYAFQFCLNFAGLRGAIAFALAMKNTTTQTQRMVLTATLVIVNFTVFVFGGGTTTVLQKLQIKVHVPEHDEEEDDYAEVIAPVTDNTKEGWMRAIFRKLDSYYLFPVLSNPPNNVGLDSYQAIKKTVGEWWDSTFDKTKTYLKSLDDDTLANPVAGPVEASKSKDTFIPLSKRVESIECLRIESDTESEQESLDLEIGEDFKQKDVHYKDNFDDDDSDFNSTPFGSPN